MAKRSKRGLEALCGNRAGGSRAAGQPGSHVVMGHGHGRWVDDGRAAGSMGGSAEQRAASLSQYGCSSSSSSSGGGSSQQPAMDVMHSCVRPRRRWTRESPDRLHRGRRWAKCKCKGGMGWHASTTAC
ncbi:hypothetical protein COCCADRAFT_28260 [Bipolaris zeicola 26-R-13]|uniref:Uncharacterized protein n=1 Tax=Cochliobolus carbonum (strain 26-R-13) TaxID=930089 RepID=W6Y036_COCC2|nr:uncharacterized protein COCCADRAFT_28260 [Bipolaris zeicola 26-R-13]EUC30925.1 hypothetical protein COCCADRAFT_28260 [Bipolaris zeicola 26-R-13]